MMFLLGLAADDEDVVHVDGHDSFVNELSKDVINHCLECHWAVSETKEHDKRFKQALVIQKATFHSSPYLILMLLYPHWTSSLVKYFALAPDTILRMLGSGEGVGIL